MIKLKSLLTEITMSDVDKQYSPIKDLVDGRVVLDKIDNMSSLGASLYNYDVLEGIREVPMSDFYVTGKHYSVEGTKKIQKLATDIQESGEISPLIVVVDKDGPYVLEGSHRLSALKLLNAKSFPALIAVDFD